MEDGPTARSVANQHEPEVSKRSFPSEQSGEIRGTQMVRLVKEARPVTDQHEPGQASHSSSPEKATCSLQKRRQKPYGACTPRAKVHAHQKQVAERTRQS